MCQQFWGIQYKLDFYSVSQQVYFRKLNRIDDFMMISLLGPLDKPFNPVDGWIYLDFVEYKPSNHPCLRRYRK